jgi:hypothetical protein
MSIMTYWVCIEAVQWSAGAARLDSGPIAIGAFSGFGVPATGRTAALPPRPGVEIGAFSCIMRGFNGYSGISGSSIGQSVATANPRLPALAGRIADGCRHCHEFLNPRNSWAGRTCREGGHNLSNVSLFRP